MTSLLLSKIKHSQLLALFRGKAMAGIVIVVSKLDGTRTRPLLAE